MLLAKEITVIYIVLQLSRIFLSVLLPPLCFFASIIILNVLQHRFQWGINYPVPCFQCEWYVYWPIAILLRNPDAVTQETRQARLMLAFFTQLSLWLFHYFLFLFLSCIPYGLL
jgi:hypothetical protein